MGLLTSRIRIADFKDRAFDGENIRPGPGLC
jgi:hypothetical protein